MEPHLSSRADQDDPDERPHRDLVIRVGHEELIVRQRYETLSIVNDAAAAVLFIVGSALFFRPATSTAATWLFLIGSTMMLFRPMIRLTRRIHLRRHHTVVAGRPHETAMDF